MASTNMAGHGMGWDPTQREILEALGHVVYRVAPAQGPVVPDDALVHAMLRAAGRSPEADDAALLCHAWPTTRLRGDAAAKRALWPQLRALRMAARAR
jgi:DNA polymerase III psi subunit